MSRLSSLSAMAKRAQKSAPKDGEQSSAQRQAKRKTRSSSGSARRRATDESAAAVEDGDSTSPDAKRQNRASSRAAATGRTSASGGGAAASNTGDAVQNLLSSLPSSSSPDRDIAAFLREATIDDGPVDVLDMEDVTSLEYNSSNYEKRKSRDVARFFKVLSSHPRLRFLSENTYDEELGRNSRRFYQVLRGTKTESKWEILNACLLVFGKSLVKKEYRDVDRSTLSETEAADSMYQPNVVALMYRHLFADFAKNSILFRQSRDFNRQGSFQARWKFWFNETAKRRSDYGCRPNAPEPDAQMEYKIRNCADPPLKPYESLDDMLLLLVHYVLVYFKLRASKEPFELTHEHFQFGVKTEGPYKGYKFVKLLFSNADKVLKLSLSNPLLRDHDGCHDMIENPNDEFCIVRLLQHHLTHYCPPNVGRIFRRAATQKEMRERRNLGETHLVGMTAQSVFGRNYFNIKAVELARRCGFDKPEKNTAQSKRCAGISKLVNSKENIAGEEIHGASRHKHAVTNALYQRPDEETKGARYRAAASVPLPPPKNESSAEDSASVASSSSSSSSPKNPFQIAAPSVFWPAPGAMMPQMMPTQIMPMPMMPAQIMPQMMMPAQMMPAQMMPAQMMPAQMMMPQMQMPQMPQMMPQAAMASMTMSQAMMPMFGMSGATVKKEKGKK